MHLPLAGGRLNFSHFLGGWSESRSIMSSSLQPHGLYSPWNSPGQNSGVGRLSFLQGIFPTQGSNSGLLYCRQILYQLSQKGSPRILEWVAYPFSSGSFNPEIEPRSPALQADSLPLRYQGRPYSLSNLSTWRLPFCNFYFLLAPALFNIIKHSWF